MNKTKEPVQPLPVRLERRVRGKKYTLKEIELAWAMACCDPYLWENFTSALPDGKSAAPYP